MSLVGIEDRGAVRHVLLQRAEKRNAFNGELISALGHALEEAAGRSGRQMRGSAAMARCSRPAWTSTTYASRRRTRAACAASVAESWPGGTCSRRCPSRPSARSTERASAARSSWRWRRTSGSWPRTVAGIMEGAWGYTRRGRLPRLPAIVGLGNAKELIMTGKPIDGREAHRNRLRQPDRPRRRARRVHGGLRQRVAGRGPAGGRPGQAGDGRRGLPAWRRPWSKRSRHGGAGRERGLRRGGEGVLREALAEFAALRRQAPRHGARGQPARPPTRVPRPQR